MQLKQLMTGRQPVLRSCAQAAASGAVLLATAGAAAAAGTNTGVQQGFYDLGQDLNTILFGAGGFVIMIVSIIVGGVMLAVTQRVGPAIMALGTALFLGYGVQTVTNLGGVTASTALLAAADPDTLGLATVE
ncbi:hypothetical protein [Chachezhania sediminis]|uniref:hypothetical protein n=1 Tax=Chachezhania sediminis TaxID=2599291 RepID=UPI00131ECDCE|nr:hypothetical protein [Chachezhania sediminis]